MSERFVSSRLGRLYFWLTMWRCNLGWHKPQWRGTIMGHTETFGNTTISYLDCHRCGRTYIGSLSLPSTRRFP